MPLDPQAKALLDEFAAAGAPPPWKVPLADLRVGFDELSAALAAPAPRGGARGGPHGAGARRRNSHPALLARI